MLTPPVPLQFKGWMGQPGPLITTVMTQARWRLTLGYAHPPPQMCYRLFTAPTRVALQCLYFFMTQPQAHFKQRVSLQPRQWWLFTLSDFQRLPVSHRSHLHSCRPAASGFTSCLLSTVYHAIGQWRHVSPMEITGPKCLLSPVAPISQVQS